MKDVLDKIGDPYEILVVDNVSSDDTTFYAEKVGARLVCHLYIIGNGAVKTSIRMANGQILVMLDAGRRADRGKFCCS